MPQMSPRTREIEACELSRWFAEEVLPHEALLRAYLRARFPRLPDVDDFVQESYARIIRVRSLRGVTSPKALLFTITRNAAHDFFRRKKLVCIENMDAFADSSVLVDAPNAAEDASHAQEIELLQNSIRALPERCLQVVTLRMLYGLSHKEIGRKLGIAENTVNNQLAIGLQRCRQYLTARGMTGSGSP